MRLQPGHIQHEARPEKITAKTLLQVNSAHASALHSTPLSLPSVNGWMRGVPLGVQFGNIQQAVELKPPIPEAGIDPALLACLRRVLSASSQSSTVGGGVKFLTMAETLKGMLQDGEYKKQMEKAFINVLKIAPPTFIKHLDEARAAKLLSRNTAEVVADAEFAPQDPSAPATKSRGIMPSSIDLIPQPLPQREVPPQPGTPDQPLSKQPVRQAGAVGEMAADFFPAEVESKDGKGLSDAVSELMQHAMGQLRQRLKAEKSDEPAIIGLPDLLSAIFTSNNPKVKPFRDALLAISYLRLMDGKIASSILDDFSEDLTLEYEAGNLSPVIGRDEEAINMLTALTKIKKRNPLLVGEAGTGKTAIVEKLAGWLVEKKVPRGLIREDGRGLFLKQLNWSKLEALGAQQAKQVLEELIREVKDRKEEVLIFLDETHRIAPEFDSMGLANMWKEPLARGHIALIGATTQDEYRKRIKKDPALDRRFHEVVVQEPSLPQTHTILRGIREYFEMKHGVVLRDDALEAAAFKSKRYMPGKYMPDCAIDVIDTACAMVKNQVNGTPYPQLKQQGEIYLETIKMQMGLQKRVAEFQSDVAPLEALIQQKKDKTLLDIRTALATTLTGTPPETVQQVFQTLVEQRLNSPLTQPVSITPANIALATQIESRFAEPTQELVKLMRQAHLKRRSLSEAEKELQEVHTKIETLKGQLIEARVLPVVGTAEILQVISEQANVPVQKLSEDEEDKLLKMKDEVRKRVIGQSAAVEAMVAAIQKNKLGMSKGSRPIGSFLFVGPTGVGKTELAKTVAEYLFGDENSMIRVDMSELMEEHSVSKLIGSPPGYVGYDDGGQLTEKVRKRPYSVILLDEVEKAHPRVFDLLLQILDDGRLTDSQGRTVDFKNAIVVMTSNKGTEELMLQFEQVGGDMDPESPRFMHMYRNLKKFAKRVITSDRRTFRPEFLNRIDETVVFHPLMQAHIKEIIPIQLKGLNKDLLNTEAKVQVSLEPTGVEYLAEKGTDVVNGARPLKRLMDNIKSAIAEGLLNRTIQPGDHLKLTADILQQWESEMEARRK